MSLQGTLLDRIKWLMQDPLLDTDAPGWQRVEVLQRLQQETTRLARSRAFLAPVWCQGVAGRTQYPLNTLAVFGQTGIATGGSSTTLVDSGADFVTSGVQVGDRVRLSPDGSQALVTTVAATTLTLSAGFAGGALNAAASGDTYVIETPLQQSQICEVLLVLYDGQRLDYATPDALDNAHGRWETRRTGPRYWTVDDLTSPSVLHLSPPPLVTGSAALHFPPYPFPTDWEDNLLLFVCEQPQGTFDEADDSFLLPHWEDLIVMRSAETLAMMESEHQDLPLSQGLGVICKAWARGLGMGTY